MTNRTALPFEWTSLVLIAKERKADVHMRVRPGAIIEADEIIQALVAENLRLNKEAYTWWEAAVQRKPIAAPISPASIAGSAGDGTAPAAGNLRIAVEEALATAPPALLQQALEALELAAPFPSNEARWSAAINAIYAQMAEQPAPQEDGKC